MIIYVKRENKKFLISFVTRLFALVKSSLKNFLRYYQSFFLFFVVILLDERKKPRKFWNTKQTRNIKDRKFFPWRGFGEEEFYLLNFKVLWKSQNRISFSAGETLLLKIRKFAGKPFKLFIQSSKVLPLKRVFPRIFLKYLNFQTSLDSNNTKNLSNFSHKHEINMQGKSCLWICGVFCRSTFKQNHHGNDSTIFLPAIKYNWVFNSIW